jgi:hypothetical protein
VLRRDRLPEAHTDLVAALTRLDVHDLSHPLTLLITG